MLLLHRLPSLAVEMKPAARRLRRKSKHENQGGQSLGQKPKPWYRYSLKSHHHYSLLSYSFKLIPHYGDATFLCDGKDINKIRETRRLVRNISSRETNNILLATATPSPPLPEGLSSGNVWLQNYNPVIRRTHVNINKKKGQKQVHLFSFYYLCTVISKYKTSF